MGYYHSTYFAYGVHIPTDSSAWEEEERITEVLKPLKDRCPDVRTLSAGDYDRNMLFLVTESTEIDLGDYGRTSSATAEQHAAWDAQLAAAVEALGYGDRRLEAAGWLCVPDLS
ncbi:hypothetical protein ACIP5N_33950 [Streptomyces sp. NPDC088768]|uniref:hypothetical protein n=1 Tax=Streptomyces sp. NPDC088768 TaxID=3365894 RepID=UPI0038110929